MKKKIVRVFYHNDKAIAAYHKYQTMSGAKQSPMREDQTRGNSFAVFRYYGTANLGDAIQSIALSRLLPGRIHGIARDSGQGPKDAVWVINGWLGNNTIPDADTNRGTLFAGVYLAQERNLAWLERSPAPVGARDPVTHEILIRSGIASELIGCATITFPKYDGPREGCYSVDVKGSQAPKSAVHMTHDLLFDVSWQDQWSQALAVLECYRRAEIVYTSRLHVALPCLAFGTPVVFHPPEPEHIYEHDRMFERVSILPHWGLEYGKAVEMDVSPYAQNFRAFLERNLGISVPETSSSGRDSLLGEEEGPV